MTLRGSKRRGKDLVALHVPRALSPFASALFSGGASIITGRRIRISLLEPMTQQRRLFSKLHCVEDKHSDGS